MSEIYVLQWSAYGTAEVEADSLDEAQEIMHDALNYMSDIDVDRIDTDGSETREA